MDLRHVLLRPVSLFRLLTQSRTAGPEPPGPEPSTAAVDVRRSLFVRHVDCGSCNACEQELNALTNRVYNLDAAGIRFEASPRHADALVVTGVGTPNMQRPAVATRDATPLGSRTVVIAVGDCAVDGQVPGTVGAPADADWLAEWRADAVKVAGCPPHPREILEALTDHGLMERIQDAQRSAGPPPVDTD